MRLLPKSCDIELSCKLAGKKLRGNTISVCSLEGLVFHEINEAISILVWYQLRIFWFFVGSCGVGLAGRVSAC